MDARRRTWDASVTTKPLLSVDDLVAAGLIAKERAPRLRAVEARYGVAVTPQIATLIDPTNADDPIGKQFLPDERELDTKTYEIADPIGDDIHSPIEGVVHRYADRALVKLLTVCPVYCRFCFRRETVGRGKGDLLSDEAAAAAFAYIAKHREIFEVILTGGDPLALSARRLGAASARLAEIGHVRLLRVHTRAPIAAPELVDPERIDALRASGKALYVAIHVNHWQELSEAARAAILRLRDAGASLLSQSVLLAGVNDDADALERLMRELVSLGVKPAPSGSCSRHGALPLELGDRPAALRGTRAARLRGCASGLYARHSRRLRQSPGAEGKCPARRGERKLARHGPRWTETCLSRRQISA
jgi:lysine 2,3-aminomutase